MGTEYRLTKELSIDEMSCKFQFSITKQVGGEQEVAICATETLTESELRSAIIKQIEVLSYFSEDPDEVLSRFNVNYGDKA